MALKPGGIVISLLEAREINDPPEYMQSFHFNDVIEMEKAVRNKFTIPFFIAYRLFLLCQNSTVYIVTRKENFDTVKKTGQIPVETLEEAWSLAQKQLAERGLKDYTVNIMRACCKYCSNDRLTTDKIPLFFRAGFYFTKKETPADFLQG